MWYINRPKFELMNRILSRFIIPVLVLLIYTGCNHKSGYIKIAMTTDVHGMIFPVDLITGHNIDYSLAHIYSYIKEQESASDTSFLIFDNGDFLQGQPTVYFYNFLDTTGDHISSRVMNLMGYEAATVGNHDIETGPAIYNKVRREMNFPWLAANAVDKTTGKPYFEPYTIVNRDGHKIAILGLITPGIPNWLPGEMWPGMEFRDMLETAKKWVPIIENKEHPDILIGLFHSGLNASYGGGDPNSKNNENASLLVAREVPGFDIVFAGHDHGIIKEWVLNVSGDSVLVIDPGSHARYVGEALIHFSGESSPPSISGRIINASDYQPDDDFMELFNSDFENVRRYLADTVTFLEGEILGAEALFGPSALTALIHSMQLNISGADISFTAPLSTRIVLPEGYLRVSDMFNLYRYENLLYKMRMSGEEIDRYLEYSTSKWFNVMKTQADHLLLFSESEPGKLMNPYYNFSSAAGIDYTIHLDKPDGNRVEIIQFSDGRAFDPEAFYSVAVNSYRGNGGGGHMTSGAGIARESLTERILWSSDHDLRYFLMKELMKQDTVKPGAINNWDFKPEKFYRSALEKDKLILMN